MRIAAVITLALLVGCGQSSPAPQQKASGSDHPAVSGAEAQEPEDGDIPWTSYPHPDPAEKDAASELTAKVIKIIDGDTIDVLTSDRESIRIRLNGIDCPERGQPFGNNAKEYLSTEISGAMVEIQLHGQDRYGRSIGDVYRQPEFDPDSGDMTGGILVNLELVRKGLAWHYVKYAPDRSDLPEGEQSARQAKAGLWSGSHKPIPPWDWRRMSKEERDQYR